jgi:hypothetical protein
MLRVITATSASARLNAAADFLTPRPPSSEVVIVGASRGAADDFARSIARRAGATFGLMRFSLTQLAARAAAVRLAGASRAPLTQAGAEATAARVVFDALGGGRARILRPVASMPGFPKALARTLYELRLAAIAPDRLMASNADPALRLSVSQAGRDIGRLLARVEGQMDRAAVSDRAALFHLAAEACIAGEMRWAGLPVVLLDVPLDSRAEREFAAALVACAPDACATVPQGDECAREAWAGLGVTVEAVADPAEGTSDLACLRRYVFTLDRPPERERLGDVRLFSAPGEGREAVEIVRRVLDEAARGVPFDEMAVFLRTPQQYLGLLEHACGEAACPCISTEAPPSRIRLAARSSRCCPARPKASRRSGSTSTSRSARCRRSRCRGWQPRRHDALLGAARLSKPRCNAGRDRRGRDSAIQRPMNDADPAGEPSRPIDSTTRPCRRHAAIAVEMGRADRRIGRRRRPQRADGKARWRRRLDGLAADIRYRIEELQKDEPKSRAIARFDARSAEPRALAAVRAAHRRRASPDWPSRRAGASGSIGFRAAGARAAAARRAAAAGRSAADGRRRPVRSRRRATCCTTAW